MPSHQDRVRKNMCPKHNWFKRYGVIRQDTHHFVLDGYECFNCRTIISELEWFEKYKPLDQKYCNKSE